MRLVEKLLDLALDECVKTNEENDEDGQVEKGDLELVKNVDEGRE